MSKPKWILKVQGVLGIGWTGVCVWKLIGAVEDGLARGFGTQVVVHSARYGTGSQPVWVGILALGFGVGLGVRVLYESWLEYDEE